MAEAFRLTTVSVCREIPRGDGDKQGGMGEGRSGCGEVFRGSPSPPHILSRASLQRVCQRRCRHEEFQRGTFTHITSLVYCSVVFIEYVLVINNYIDILFDAFSLE